MPPEQGFHIEPLGRHDRRGFGCGVDDLDRYLHRHAGQDMRRNVAAVMVLLATGSEEVIGYYTLCATAIELQAIPDEHARRLPKYPVVPATLLGRVAVDTRFAGRGLGETLLIDALRRSLQSSSRVASWAVVVDAKEGVVPWYQRYGFQVLPDTPGRLFLPMATIARAVEQGGVI